MIPLKIKARKSDVKPRALLKHGSVPGVIYGPDVNSKEVKVDRTHLAHAMDQTGEIYQVKSARGLVMVKMAEIQTDPVTNQIIYFSLVQMPKGEENTIQVPIAFRGESLAEKNGGIVIPIKDELSISGKPQLLPTELPIDLSKFDIGDKVTVKDLNLSDDLELKHDLDDVIVTFTPAPKMKEIVKEDEREII